MKTRRLVVILATFSLLMLTVAACGAPSAPTVAPPTTAPVVQPTSVPPTATSVPPTATSVPPTVAPPSPTAVPATATALPATATPIAATAAPTAAPTVAAPTAVLPTATKAAAAATPTSEPTTEVPRPSNAGGPGAALNLTGDLKNGLAVFTSKAQDKNCATCHGVDGKGGVANPGSTDGTIPPLNPIDDALKDKDPKVFAYNIDLFIEHGSTPDGPNPQQTMPAWGDEKKLSPQEIADVIAYVMSLNK